MGKGGWGWEQDEVRGEGKGLGKRHDMIKRRGGKYWLGKPKPGKEPCGGRR